MGRVDGHEFNPDLVQVIIQWQCLQAVNNGSGSRAPAAFERS